MSRWKKWMTRGTPGNPSRRAFIGGAAAMITLPWFESLASANQGGPPLRMMFWYIPNGIRMEQFTPASTGASYTLPTLLQPYQDVRDKLMILSNVSQNAGRDSLAGDHARGTASFLTATRASRPGQPVQLGPSVDHLASLAPSASATRLRSLHLATANAGTTGSCDSGYPCAFQNSITWSSATAPVPPRTDPLATFDALFGGVNDTASEAAAARRHLRRASVLDHVVGEAQTLQNQLSATDRTKLDQYLTGVRELEQRVQANPPNNGAPVCDPGDRPTSINGFGDRLDQMMDILVKAAECDITRVMSLMADRSGSYRSFPDVGVSEGHHEMSHWATGDAAAQAHRKDQWAAINGWHLSRFATFLRRLDGITESDGTTVLDNSMIFCSSEIADGNRHNHDDMPVIFAGGGCGQVDTGRHVRFGTQQPLANLFLGMLDRFGAPQPTFGMDGDSILPNVFI